VSPWLIAVAGPRCGGGGAANSPAESSTPSWIAPPLCRPKNFTWAVRGAQSEPYLSRPTEPPADCARSWASPVTARHYRQNRILTIDTGTVYRSSSQAGPGNDINAGSPGSQKAPTWSPASLVGIRANASRAASRRSLPLCSFGTAQPVARARWRRCFAFSLALRLLARIVVLALMIFFT
jgi:hypothetical protein